VGEDAVASGIDGELDAWVRSRLAGTAELVAAGLDAYDATGAGRAIAEFVEDLSNWYVRRSRRRFWDGDTAAFLTLRECLLTVSKLLAPFCPFLTDEIYDNLDGSLASVHLCDFPAGDALPARDLELENAMSVARETVRLGLAARRQAVIKVRQPLAEAIVVAAGPERAAIERLADVVRDELNVKQVRFVAGTDELVTYELKANYRSLGPRFGPAMPKAAAAIAALDPARVAAAMRAGETVVIAVEGADHELQADDLLLGMSPLAGYSMEREGGHAVALELALDDALVREGLAREIVHAVQGARRNAGLAVEDRIVLALDGAQTLLDVAREHEHYVVGETLAVEISYGDASHDGGWLASEALGIDGRELTVTLRAAA
jgi:isoleucyl-tRNA synthetase